jgi:hypothetical protein
VCAVDLFRLSRSFFVIGQFYCHEVRYNITWEKTNCADNSKVLFIFPFLLKRNCSISLISVFLVSHAYRNVSQFDVIDLSVNVVSIHEDYLPSMA